MTSLSEPSATVLAGSSHEALASSIATELGLRLGPYAAQRFPDGEMYVALGPDIEGHEVVIVQHTGNPGGDNLLELLLLADAARRASARSCIAVIPYVGYARQDHRTGREALGMRVVADALGSRVDRVIAVDLHGAAVEGLFSVPVEHLTAVPLLADAIRPTVTRRSVIVAPDLGAAKLARAYASALELPMAIVHKTRLSATEVISDRVIGDVRGLEPILVDDMVTTGGTLAAAADVLVRQGAAPTLRALATHAVLVPGATDRLRDHGILELVVTDTLPLRESSAFPMRVVGVGPMIARTIRGLS